MLTSPKDIIEHGLKVGRLCAYCRQLLDEPYPGAPRFCQECSAPHRVHCDFESKGDSFVITFTEKNLRKVLGKRQYKTSLGKLRDLHEKYAAERKLEDRQAFDYAINVGVGAMWLNLPFGHYMKLMEDQ